MALEKDLGGMSVSCDGLMDLLVREIVFVPSRSYQPHQELQSRTEALPSLLEIAARADS
jgi:hypothetical protein